MFINSIEQIAPSKDLDQNLKYILNRFWPGKLTLIYKKQGYRIPDNPLLLKLIKDLGPLYSTSANISGQTPIKKLNDAQRTFKEHLNDLLAVDCEQIPSGVESTIYDFDNKKVIREGAIKIFELFN